MTGDSRSQPTSEMPSIWLCLAAVPLLTWGIGFLSCLVEAGMIYQLLAIGLIIFIIYGFCCSVERRILR